MKTFLDYSPILFFSLCVVASCALLVYHFISRQPEEIVNETMPENNVTILDDTSPNQYRSQDANGYHSAQVLGTHASPTNTPVYHQYPTPAVTTVPETNTQQIDQQVNAPSNPWDGYTDKKAYCEVIANGTVDLMKQDPPNYEEIYKDLPRELWATINYDSVYEDVLQDCMLDRL